MLSNEYQTFEMGKWKFLFNLSTFDVIEQMTKSNSNVIKSFSMKKDFQSWMLANFPNVPIKKSCSYQKIRIYQKDARLCRCYKTSPNVTMWIKHSRENFYFIPFSFCMLNDKWSCPSWLRLYTKIFCVSIAPDIALK